MLDYMESTVAEDVILSLLYPVPVQVYKCSRNYVEFLEILAQFSGNFRIITELGKNFHN